MQVERFVSNRGESFWNKDELEYYTDRQNFRTVSLILENMHHVVQ